MVPPELEEEGDGGGGNAPDDAAPDVFKCPITLSIMKEPAQTPAGAAPSPMLCLMPQHLHVESQGQFLIDEALFACLNLLPLRYPKKFHGHLCSPPLQPEEGAGGCEGHAAHNRL